jgi:hypothetical protein
MVAYKYLPLDAVTNDIRLIRLHAGRDNDELSCTLVHMPLSVGLEYRALSYAWQDPYLFPGTTSNTTEKLIVNTNWVLDIHANLSSFLRHLRGSEYIDGFLWIDAICINQQDVQERNLQVLRMCNIYNLSQYVIAWLGPERDSSTQALSFIKSPFKQESNSDKSRSVSPANFNYWNATEIELLEQGIRSGVTISAWEAVTRFFDRAWWKRTWIVQEVLLATDVLFMCGHDGLDLVKLRSFSENVWAHQDVSPYYQAY